MARRYESGRSRETSGSKFGVETQGGYAAFRNVLDPILSVLLLLPLGLIILLAMIAVRITSPGPALYTQVRVGRHGRNFTMYKIRTMYHRCEEVTGPRWSPPARDSRVTSVGKFLRRTKIDELPQIWNVLRGEMSLIGPRPERPVFVSQLDHVIPHYRDRLAVHPGLTGLAQIQLPPDTDLASVQRKLACDLYYIHHMGPWLDLRILICTVSYLMGIPFSVPQGLLQVPDGPVVDAAYRDLTDPVLRQVQPV